VGFISTPNEEKFLMSTKGQMSLAHSIYNAIVQYKEKVTGRKSHLVSIDKYEEDNVEDEQKDTKTVNANDKKQENVTANNKTSAKTSTPAKESNATIENNKPVFKIQILSGSYDLKSNDRQFKGLKTEKFKDGNRYKYFYGSSNDYNETLKKKKEIEKMFPGCYIVAFKNGKIVNTKVAIEEWEKNK
jgi:N-acetylmuramoyl-L-alanine amidase